MDERLVELETRVAFQDNTLEELNEVIISQQDQIDLLNREVKLLKEQMLGLHGSRDDYKTEDPPPPHY
ncbi:MAG: SlyX family protein [Proteobacteria bacterium]|nr:SlyX family protein [Pseudomonadota bacterium]MBU1715055.1 SlyX family protein [Pseudomonadota bacterium]